MNRHRVAVVLCSSTVLLATACGSRVGPPIRTAAVAAAPSAATPGPAPAEGGSSVAQAQASATASATRTGAPTPRPGRSTPAASAAPTGRNDGSVASVSGGGGAGPATGTQQPTGVSTTVPGQPATGTGPSSQGVTANEIRVGLVTVLSGAAGFLGQNQLDAVRAHFNLVNDRGGVKGRKIQLLSYDSQFDPAIEASAARRAIEKDKVFAVIGLLGLTTAPYAKSAGFPHIVLGGVPDAYASKYPNTYPVAFSMIDAQAKLHYLLAERLKLPIKKAAFLYDTENLPLSRYVDYLTRSFTKWGIDVVSKDPFNLSNGDCTNLVIKMRSLGVDFWATAISLGYPLCEKAMTQQNWHPTNGRGGVTTADANFVGPGGAGADGIYAEMNGVQIERNTGEPYPWDPSGRSPVVNDYVNAMKKYSPNSATIASLEAVWSQFGWTQAQLLVDAVTAQPGSVTWDGVNSWIQRQTAWLSGLTGPINFTPTCKTGSPTWVFQWKWDGKRVVESDWRPYGGHIQLPLDAANYIVPGGGDCYVTAMADKETK